MLLAYREDSSLFAVGRALGVHHQTVQRCVERAVAYGALAALDDRPRPGKEPTITAEAKAWLVDLACRKAKELGYPHESPASKRLRRRRRTCRPSLAFMRRSRATTSTNARARLAYWPGSICSPAKSMPWSKIDTAVASSSNSSSSSTPPIRRIRRSS